MRHAYGYMFGMRDLLTEFEVTFFNGLGMLQVYNVISVFIINHGDGDADWLRHGVGGGVPIVYHHHVLHICILGLY